MDFLDWILGVGKSPVNIFALFSPILFRCGICPNPGSATSPYGARDAARPFLRRSELCQTVGLSPLVRCVEQEGATCHQKS